MVKKTREMIIVPDETQVDLIEFRKELPNQKDRHGIVVKEFSDFGKLGLTFENVGVKEGVYNCYMWSIAVAKLGHIAIQKDTTIIFYLPDTITEKQYQYLKNHKKEYSVYGQNMGIVNILIQDNQFHVETIDQSNISEHEHLIDILYEIINDKYESYNHNLNGVKK